MVVKKWLRLAAPAALLAFGVTACGGNGPALDGWAKTVCAGMQSPVQQANTALADTGAVKTGETPQALQTRLASDLGSLATANAGIAQAVQKAGAPKTDNGGQIQADAVSELNQAAGGYTKVQQTVKQLTVTDQAEFAASLKSVSDQVQQLAELSTSALQKLQSGELGAALAKQPACKSVNGAAGGATGGTAPVEPTTTGGDSASGGSASGGSPTSGSSPSSGASASPGGGGSGSGSPSAGGSPSAVGSPSAAGGGD